MARGLGPLGGHLAGWGLQLGYIATAIATMTGGNLAALTQSNVKRLFAYSSIAHVGYILLGLIAGSPQSPTPNGIRGILVYLLVYTFMNLGVFGVIASWTGIAVLGMHLLRIIKVNLIWLSIGVMGVALQGVLIITSAVEIAEARYFSLVWGLLCATAVLAGAEIMVRLTWLCARRGWAQTIVVDHKSTSVVRPCSDLV